MPSSPITASPNCIRERLGRPWPKREGRRRGWRGQTTNTKNPAYRDVIYVEELIGPSTVNTIPPATFNAFREHGRLRMSLTEDLENAADTMESGGGLGSAQKTVTSTLFDDVLRQFVDAFAQLLKATGTRKSAEST